MKAMLKEFFSSAAALFIAGAVVMCGMKAIDWAIPSPPRVIQLDVSE